MTLADPPDLIDSGGQVEPTEQIELLMRDLRSSPLGLSTATVWGADELRRWLVRRHAPLPATPTVVVTS